MRRQMPPVILWLILIVWFGSVANSQETDEHQNLVYIRQREVATFQLVSLSVDGRQVYKISKDDCYSLSPGNTYLAFSLSENTTIDIYRLVDGELVLNIPSADVQPDCSFIWQSEIGVNLPGIPAAPFPAEITIPNLLQDDFRLVSPGNSLIVYNRCDGGEFTTNIFTGDQVCTSKEQVVIYDVRTQEVLQELEDANQGNFILDEYARLSTNFSGVSWSPSGRYLAYRTAANDQKMSPVGIYDAHNRRYLDLHFPLRLEIDWFKGFVWTHHEQKLVFWTRDYPSQSHRLAFVEVETEQISVIEVPHQPASAHWTYGLIPGTVAFVDDASQLVEFDLETGEAIILDTDVWDILSR